jgi:hypothetical protein
MNGKLHAMLAAILILATTAFAEIPIPVADFREPDPAFEPFGLSAQEIPDETPDEEESAEPLWWRVICWGVYLSCSTMEVSSRYRDDRSHGYSPTIGNDPARMMTVGAISIGANRSSEWLRGRDDRQLALMTRVGTLATCLYTASNNFNKGWKRR